MKAFSNLLFESLGFFLITTECTPSLGRTKALISRVEWSEGRLLPEALGSLGKGERGCLGVLPSASPCLHKEQRKPPCVRGSQSASFPWRSHSKWTHLLREKGKKEKEKSYTHIHTPTLASINTTSANFLIP